MITEKELLYLASLGAVHEYDFCKRVGLTKKAAHFDSLLHRIVMANSIDELLTQNKQPT